MTTLLQTVHTKGLRRKISGNRTMRVVRHRTMVLTGVLMGRMMRHLRLIRGGPTIIRHLRLHRTEIMIEIETKIVITTGMADHITTCTLRRELPLRYRLVKLFWCG
jgi:hypothetical protein